MEVFTTTDLAKLLQVSTVTIRREVERGKLNCFYVGNEARFTHFHIDQYTDIINFRKTAKEIELEEEINKLLEEIKAKDQTLDNIKYALLKGECQFEQDSERVD